MKNDDVEKTAKLISSTVGKVQVTEFAGYESGNHLGAFKRDERLNIKESDFVSSIFIRRQQIAYKESSK